MRFGDAAVLVDDVRDAASVFVLVGLGGAVGETDLVVDVAEQRIGEVELGGEAGVLFSGIEADAEDLGVLGCVLIVEVPEPGPFQRSARGVGLRIEPEDDLPAAQLAQLDAPAVVIRDVEVRREIANLEHGSPSEQHGFDEAKLASERHEGIVSSLIVDRASRVAGRRSRVARRWLFGRASCAAGVAGARSVDPGVSRGNTCPHESARVSGRQMVLSPADAG